MLTSRSLLTIGLFAAAVTSSFASSVTGTWYGRVDLSAVKMDAKMLAQQKSMASKMVIELNVKADKSYTVTVTGFGPKPNTSKGTWSQKGSVLTMVEGKQPTPCTVSKDGKTLTLVVPAPAGMKIVFTRTKPKG